MRKIPIPEFYVLYTGEAPWNDKILRLSDSFDLKTDGEKIPEKSMELVVKVIDLRYTEAVSYTHLDVYKRQIRIRVCLLIHPEREECCHTCRNRKYPKVRLT